jgi:DNA mismatch endonuclease (patch repair protein)
MTDIWSREKRSAVMARIRGITAPERRLRALLVQQRVRGFRVGAKVGNAKPDLVFPNDKVAVFVDGCFWHGCPRCYVRPKTRVSYWSSKIANNMRRDSRQRRALRRSGWHVVRVWECQLEQNPSGQIERILKFLDSSSRR